MNPSNKTIRTQMFLRVGAAVLSVLRLVQSPTADKRLKQAFLSIASVVPLRLRSPALRAQSKKGGIIR